MTTTQPELQPSPESLPPQDSAVALLRAAVDASPFGMLLVAEGGRILLANRQAAEMFGWPETALVGQPVEALMPVSARARHEAHRGAYEAAPTARPMSGRTDLMGQRADGTVFPVEVGLSSVTIDGRRVTIAGVVDVSDRRRHERELAEREARLQALMHNATDGIAIVGGDGRIRDANPRLAAMLGAVQERSLVGFAVRDLPAVPGTEERLVALLEALRGHGGEVPGVQLQRPDGKRVRIDFSLSREPVGAEVLVLMIGRETTRQQELEQQLRQAQRLEAVGRLAGGVAHDFNNLLTVITGHAEFVGLDLPDGHPLRDSVREILDASSRASDLTRQLLAFSKQQVLAPRTADANALVRGLEKLLRRLIGEDVRLITRLHEAELPIFVDPSQFDQALMNLAVNARDAMPHGGRLVITTGRELLDEAAAARLGPLAPGDYVTITVTDDGVGISAEALPLIFEPFYTTKEPGKGTGLGLATVYGIVQQSGGHILVKSEPDRGSAFRIFLPVAQARAATTPIPSAARPTAGRETILLVEDEPGVRRVARETLARAGYRIVEAASGDDALARVARHEGEIAILVTDVVMPGISGRVLADRLLAMRPGIRVLFTSGYAHEALTEHGMFEPGVAFLPKPYTTESLVARVREVLDAPAAVR